jgi:hypothetical protein
MPYTARFATLNVECDKRFCSIRKSLLYYYNQHKKYRSATTTTTKQTQKSNPNQKQELKNKPPKLSPYRKPTTTKKELENFNCLLSKSALLRWV